MDKGQSDLTDWEKFQPEADTGIYLAGAFRWWINAVSVRLFEILKMAHMNAFEGL